MDKAGSIERQVYNTNKRLRVNECVSLPVNEGEIWTHQFCKRKERGKHKNKACAMFGYHGEASPTKSQESVIFAMGSLSLPSSVH
jgi:hypothetical protein